MINPTNEPNRSSLQVAYTLQATCKLVTETVNFERVEPASLLACSHLMSIGFASNVVVYKTRFLVEGVNLTAFDLKLFAANRLGTTNVLFSD